MNKKILTEKNQAFTLAEVMIVIVIIGVVAVFTLPVLLSEVTERVNSNRQANIAQKVTKAVELMIVGGDYENFDTTDEFVDKLQKYLKIAKRCDSNNLTKCWPSKIISKSDGSKYDVDNAKTGKELHINNETNNVGLVLADGGSIILTYNPNATIPNADIGFKPTKKSLPIGGGKTKEFAYTSNATNAIDFVMDVNGGQGPNAETDLDGNYYDIRSFKMATFSNAVCPGFYFSETCIYNIQAGEYSPINCQSSANAKYCQYMDSRSYNFDYFGGAIKACDDLGMTLIDSANLVSLFQSNDSKVQNFPAGYYWVRDNDKTAIKDSYRAFAYTKTLSRDANKSRGVACNAICIRN